MVSSVNVINAMHSLRCLVVGFAVFGAILLCAILHPKTFSVLIPPPPSFRASQDKTQGFRPFSTKGSVPGFNNIFLDDDVINGIRIDALQRFKCKFKSTKHLPRRIRCSRHAFNVRRQVFIKRAINDHRSSLEKQRIINDKIAMLEKMLSSHPPTSEQLAPSVFSSSISECLRIAFYAIIMLMHGHQNNNTYFVAYPVLFFFCVETICTDSFSSAPDSFCSFLYSLASFLRVHSWDLLHPVIRNNFRFAGFFALLFLISFVPHHEYLFYTVVTYTTLDMAVHLFMNFFIDSTPRDMITFYATIESIQSEMTFNDRIRRYCYHSGVRVLGYLLEQYLTFCEYLDDVVLKPYRTFITSFIPNQDNTRSEEDDTADDTDTESSDDCQHSSMKPIDVVCSSLSIVLVLLTCYSVFSADIYSVSASSSCGTFRSSFPPTISSNNFTCALSREALNHILLCGGDTETNPGPRHVMKNVKNLKPGTDSAPAQSAGQTESAGQTPTQFLDETLGGLSLSQRREIVLSSVGNIKRLHEEKFLTAKDDHLPKDKDGNTIRGFPCLFMDDEKAQKERGNKFTFYASYTANDQSTKKLQFTVWYRKNFERGSTTDARKGLFVGDNAFTGIPFYHWLTIIAAGETFGMISQLHLTSRRRKISGMTLPLDPNHDHDIDMNNDNSTSLIVVQGMNCNQHNSGCVNPLCVSLDFDSTNISRKDCDPEHCQHYSKCDAPGSNTRRFKQSCGVSLGGEEPIFEYKDENTNQVHEVHGLTYYLKKFDELKLRVPGRTDADMSEDKRTKNKDRFDLDIKAPLLRLAQESRTVPTHDKAGKDYLGRNRGDVPNAKKEGDLSILTFFGTYSARGKEKKRQLAAGGWSETGAENVNFCLDPKNYVWANGDVESQDNGWVENLFAGNTTFDPAGRPLVPFTVAERLQILKALDEASQLHVYNTHSSVATGTIIRILTQCGAFVGENGKLDKSLQQRLRDKFCYYDRCEFPMHRVPFIILFDRFDLIWGSVCRYMQISHRNHHGQDYRLSNLMLESHTYNGSRQGCYGFKKCWHRPRCQAPGLYALYSLVPGLSMMHILDDLNSGEDARDPRIRIRCVRRRQYKALNWIAYQRQMRDLSAPGLPDYPPDLHLPLPEDWQQISAEDDETRYFRQFLDAIHDQKGKYYQRLLKMVRRCVSTENQLYLGLIALMYFNLLPDFLDDRGFPENEHQLWKLSFLQHLHPRREDSVDALQRWFGFKFWSQIGSSVGCAVMYTNPRMATLEVTKNLTYLQNRFPELKLKFGPRTDKRILQLSFEFWSGSQARQRCVDFHIVSLLFQETREWAINPGSFTRGCPDLLDVPFLAKQPAKKVPRNNVRFPFEHFEFSVWAVCGFMVRSNLEKEVPGYHLHDRQLRSIDVFKTEELHFVKADSSFYCNTPKQKFRVNDYVKNALEVTRQQLLPIIAEENRKLDELIKIIEVTHRQQFSDSEIFKIKQEDYFKDTSQKVLESFSAKQKADYAIERRKASYVIFLASRSQQEARELLKHVSDAGYEHKSLPWCVPHYFVRKNPLPTEYGLLQEMVDLIDEKKNPHNNAGKIDLTKLKERGVVCQFDAKVGFVSHEFHILFREHFDNADLKRLNPTKVNQRLENNTANESGTDGDSGTDEDDNPAVKPAKQKTATRRARTTSATKKKTTKKINEDDDDDNNSSKQTRAPRSNSTRKTNNNKNNNNNNMMPVQQDSAAASAGPTKRTTSSRSQRKQQQQQIIMIDLTPSTDAAAPNNNTTAAAANRRGGSSSTKKPGTKLEFNK